MALLVIKMYTQNTIYTFKFLLGYAVVCESSIYFVEYFLVVVVDVFVTAHYLGQL